MYQKQGQLKTIARNLLFTNTIPDDMKIQLYGSMLKHLTKGYEALSNKPIKVEVSNHPTIMQNQTKNLNEEVEDSEQNENKEAQDSEKSEAKILSVDDENLIDFIPSSYLHNATYLIKKLKKHPSLIQ